MSKFTASDIAKLKKGLSTEKKAGASSAPTKIGSVPAYYVR
ncbi:hypothetical protein [Nocardia nova]